MAMRTKPRKLVSLPTALILCVLAACEPDAGTAGPPEADALLLDAADGDALELDASQPDAPDAQDASDAPDDADAADSCPVLAVPGAISIENGVEFVEVAAGAVYLGCSPTLDHFCADPVWQADAVGKVATLPTFQIMRTEVTCAHWSACHAAGKCADYVDELKLWQHPWNLPDELTYKWPGLDCLLPGSENLPVREITLAGATNFCAAMFANGALPTEAEWEKAARGPWTNGPCGDNERTYPWGEWPRFETISAELVPFCTDHSWNPVGVNPVGTHPAGNSPYGVADLCGNSDEWVVEGWAKGGDVGRPIFIGKGKLGGAQDEYLGKCGMEQDTSYNIAARNVDKQHGGFRCVVH
jgi:formylglycine-generating enzyme required for sulfatase activity